MKRLLLTTFLLIFFFTTNSQEKKKLTILRVANAPKIDGVLDDLAWENAEQASGFTQLRPDMGVPEKEHQKTIVKMAYDDNAIYICAHLKDKPEDIQKQLTSRDEFGQSDFFEIILNPNNDAQNDTKFFILSSGTQADALSSPSMQNGNDFGWNAVWDSAVKIVEDGWIVEVKIPYRELRFSNDDIQTWGLQFHRRFRINNSQYSWSPIDRTIGNSGIYHGELNGIQHIKPPTRLTFYPFVSGITTSLNGKNETDLTLGLDLKYGITENFTLDATLIPDFSQAGFDNLRLNLGPFEQTFSEQRQFFTEGVDLFSKGNLFFSRRVGSAPVGAENIEDELINNNIINEEIIDNPAVIKTLNAIKVSGRNKKGLGIGFFNAITEKTAARIKTTEYTRDSAQEITDSIISYRNRITESLANYNILVIDQQFRGNSSVSLINTNVTRNGKFRDANVTGALFDISNKANKYNYRGEVKTSTINEDGTIKTGFSSMFRFAKTSGNYRYNFGHTLANRTYDINDLGLINRNNYSNFFGNASYQIFEPTKKLNSLSLNLSANYNSLYKPGKYTGNDIEISIEGQTKKLLRFNGNIGAGIGKQHDYFGPRDIENNRFFTFKNWFNTRASIETNENKPLSIELSIGMGTLFDNERDLFSYNFSIEPTWLLSDKFKISYEYKYRNGKGARDWVDTNDTDIVYGERDQVTVENSISSSYNFDPLNSLKFKFRHYWTTVDYDYSLFSLLDNGKLNSDSGYNVDNIGFNPNINFSTWNLDLNYSWQFAQGSFLTALYRNQLFNSDELSEEYYFNTLNTLFNQPIQHTFSLRLQFFIDYNNAKNILKKKINS
jgi:hypothetical protein